MALKLTILASIISGVFQKLRTVTVNNQVPTNVTSNALYDRYHVRTNIDIGSGDASKLVASFMNWYLGGAYVAGTSTYIVEAMTIENTGATVSSPVTFGGQRSSPTINIGDNDIQSDAILPSAIGLSSFARGYRAWIKITFRLPAKGNQIVGASGRNTSGSPTGVQNFWSASDTDIGLSNIDTPGQWTWTTSPGIASNSVLPCSFMLGTFTSGDPSTWLGVGDSIMEDTGDTVQGPYGNGLFQRALIGGGTAADLLAGINMARSGITIAGIVSDAKVLYWQKYCKYTAEESGTNTFGTTGTVTSPTVQAAITPLWATCRTNGSQAIVRTKLLVRSGGAWTLADQSDQTITAGWASGGNVDQFNTWLGTQVGTGVDTLVNMNYIRTGTDPYKWPADGTVGKYTIDGTHPTTFAYLGMATDLRSGMNNYT